MQTDLHWRGGFFQRALDLIYPVACAGCERPLNFSDLRFLCESCLDKVIRVVPDNCCYRCGTPGTGGKKDKSGCSDCRGINFRFTRAVCAFEYAEPVRSLIHALKFDGVRRIAEPFGVELSEKIFAEGINEKVQAILPVPLYRGRERSRGYNQSELLGAVLSSRLKLPLRIDLVLRIRDTLPQALLSREERMHNPVGAFEAKSEDLGIKSCILVDDVMTTGTTMSECAAALRKGGVEHIYAAVVAR